MDRSVQSDPCPEGWWWTSVWKHKWNEKKIKTKKSFVCSAGLCSFLSHIVDLHLHIYFTSANNGTTGGKGKSQELCILGKDPIIRLRHSHTLKYPAYYVGVTLCEINVLFLRLHYVLCSIFFFRGKSVYFEQAGRDDVFWTDLRSIINPPHTYTHFMMCMTAISHIKLPFELCPTMTYSWEQWQNIPSLRSYLMMTTLRITNFF